MQNSLDRLLTGIAEILAQDVAPHVEDRWLRSQIAAAAELLVNLAPRTTWDPAAIVAWARECRTAARAVGAETDDDLPACRAALGLPDPTVATVAEAGPDDYARLHLEALAEVAARAFEPGLSEPARAAVLAAVASQVRAEQALVRRAPERPARDS